MHNFFVLIHLLHSSTCFEHYCAHLQEDNCISTVCGIVTPFGSLFSTQVTRVSNYATKDTFFFKFYCAFGVHKMYQDKLQNCS